MVYEHCVLFGGTGFIGTHLARYLIERGIAGNVVLADLAPPRLDLWPPRIGEAFRAGRIRHAPVDVRRPLTGLHLPERAELIVNLAAVHREPGHAPEEYFETNLLGAENVCAWAEKVGCPRVVFTSSIAPYGPTEAEKDERSLPVPLTPYGASKLAAEKIHLAWQRGGDRRTLVIARPGVVFGPGEGGNVTRLVRAVLRRYFAYMGNRGTRKAGGYVKELCRALLWVLSRAEARHEGTALFNFTMEPCPAVEQYVEAACRVAGVRRLVPSLPYGLLLPVSYALDGAAALLRVRQPISPVRLRKLVRSNHIAPRYLREADYPWHYTLEEAFADWRSDRPEDWR
ncbi:MAG: NAD(P)-dependent oxidoreductase [Candidatus Lambdaproteobacteria bacterium]|nr:NAD(P)-dependent oxidoreductase [Candidatus Lambdaproteobacteria bacterium]